MYDYIIIGAGLSGSVLAQQLAEAGKHVLIIEKKNHVGGTCIDYYNEDGILVHKYGPHIFNTGDEKVWNYITRFTSFRLYHHRVLGVLGGKRVPIPFNLESMYGLFPKSYSAILEDKLLKKYGMDVKVPIMDLQQQEDPDLQYLARYIYENVFLHYTQKQWGMRPDEVGSAAMARIPFYISRDDRYFQNRFQGIPEYGYGKLFEKLLQNDNINLLLNTDYHKVLHFDQACKCFFFLDIPFQGKVILTAALDELYDYCYGELPYRTLRFEFETYQREYYQEICTVNYPNDYDFTRITEFKYMTGQQHPATTIVKEFPGQYSRQNQGEDPYYPIPQEKNESLYSKYRRLAGQCPNLILSGRLADYKYYTMADTIANALQVSERLR